MIAFVSDQKKGMLWGILFFLGCLSWTGDGGPPTPRPAKDVVLPDVAKAWPFERVGLRFQRSGGDTRYRPMGDALLTESGGVIFTFPQIDTVILAAGGDYKLTFLGPTKYGGHGEHMLGGHRVYLTETFMLLADWDRNRLYRYQRSGALIDFKSLEKKTFVPGPDGELLVGENGLFHRLDRRMRARRTFRPAGATAPVFHITSAWDVVAWHDGAHRIQHWNGEGYHLGELRLRLPDTVRILDLDYRKDCYWVLLGRAGTSLVWVINTKGETVGYWRTPFPCDGMDVTADGWLVFDRRAAAAETGGFDVGQGL